MVYSTQEIETLSLFFSLPDADAVNNNIENKGLRVLNEPSQISLEGTSEKVL